MAEYSDVANIINEEFDNQRYDSKRQPRWAYGTVRITNEYLYKKVGIKSDSEKEEVTSMAKHYIDTWNSSGGKNFTGTDIKLVD